MAGFGITCLRPRRQPVTLRWEEVSGVRQGWFPHRLILLDDDSKQRMVVPYSLVEDADELLGWVHGHWYLPRRGDGGPLALPRTFHKSIAALLAFLACFLLPLVAGTVFALVGGEYEVAILLGGLALVVSFLIAFAPGANVLGHLTVKEGEIVRHRWGLLPRRCSLGDIQGVGFSARGITLGRRGRRRPLVLGHFKESPFEVYDVLRRAWQPHGIGGERNDA